MTEQSAHLGPITACVFAGPDRLASGSIEGAVLVWDWAVGRPALRLDAHVGPVWALVYDAARSALISGGHDGSIVAHGLDGGRRWAIGAHAHGALSLALSPDGSLLASGGYDGRIGLWRAHDGAPVAMLEGHEAGVMGLDFLPDGRLASGGRDDLVRIWDVEAQRCRAEGRGHQRWVTQVRGVSDGVVSVGEDGVVCFWDAAAGAERWRYAVPGSRPIWGLALSADAGAAFVGVGGELMACRFTDTGVVEAKSISPVSSRAIAVHGESLAFGYDAGDIEVRPAGGGVFTLKGGGEAALSLAAVRDPRSRVLQAVIGFADGRVMLDAGGLRRALEPRHGTFTYVAAAVGRLSFATGGFDGLVRLWRAADGASQAVFEHGALLFSLSASADGARLLAAGGARLSLWDVATRECLWRADTPELGFHNMAALSADGHGIVAVGEGRTLRRWRLNGDGRRIESEDRVRIGLRLLTGVSLVPEGGAAVVASAEGRLFRLDLATGAHEALHQAVGDWMRTAALSPDGRFAACASQRGVAAVYDMAQRRLVTPPEMARAVVPAVTVTADGEIVYVDGLGVLRLAAL